MGTYFPHIPYMYTRMWYKEALESTTSMETTIEAKEHTLYTYIFQQSIGLHRKANLMARGRREKRTMRNG